MAIVVRMPKNIDSHGSSNTKNKVRRYNSPHDKYLKTIMDDPKIAIDFFEHNLPTKIRKLLDLNSLKQQKDSFIDDGFNTQITDVLFSVDFSTGPGYLYVLLEHTSTVDKMLPLRMLKYSIAIMEHHLKKHKGDPNVKLPVVYPMMFYTGDRAFNHSMNIYDLFGEDKKLAQSIYSKPYHLIDLLQISDAELRLYERFALAGMAMKHVRQLDSLLAKSDVLELVIELRQSGELHYIKRTFDYLTRAGNIDDPDKLLATFEEGLADQGEHIMTLEEHLINKGKAIEKEHSLQLVEQERVQTVTNLLQMGISLEQTSQATSLSLEKVKSIRDENFN